LSKSLATAGLFLFVPPARWLGVGATANICTGASIELAALANEPEPNRPDRTRFDQATLLQFAAQPSWVFVQVRGPGEESRSESPIQLPSHLAVGMEIMKRPSPLLQANRGRPPAEMSSHLRGQGGTPHPKPPGCLCVELVPRKFIYDDATARSQ
jgi:hypothetical protein